MKHDPTSTSWRTIAVAAAVCLLTPLLVVSQEGPPSAKRHDDHALALTETNVKTQRLYNTECSDSKCHAAPDPSEPNCYSGLSTAEGTAIWNYEQAMLTRNAKYSKAGGSLFESKCSTCHALPDPAQPGCLSGLAEREFARIHTYQEDSRKGKALFTSDCGSCHEAIDPQSHTFEFWSNHLCNADRHLSAESEQQILLYLSTHSLG